jgi:hypothetical protein
MSDIGIRTVKSFLNEDQRWIAPGGISAIKDADSITLKMSLFSRVTFPNNLLPSGVYLGKVTASGLYGPYDDTAVDGRQTAQGLLLATIAWPADQASTAQIPVALYWRGEVIESLLPTGSGVDAAAKVDLARIRHI